MSKPSRKKPKKKNRNRPKSFTREGKQIVPDDPNYFTASKLHRIVDRIFNKLPLVNNTPEGILVNSEEDISIEIFKLFEDKNLGVVVIGTFRMLANLEMQLERVKETLKARQEQQKEQKEGLVLLNDENPEIRRMEDLPSGAVTFEDDLTEVAPMSEEQFEEGER